MGVSCALWNFMTETLGKQLFDTQALHNATLLNNPIAAGDLANELGKQYMISLRKSVENHRKYKRGILYFFILIKKEVYNDRVIKLHIGVNDRFSGTLRHDTDVWQYDYNKEELKLLYSLPHKLAMKNFLHAPEKYSKDLLKWINQYLLQEGLTHEDLLKLAVTS